MPTFAHRGRPGHPLRVLLRAPGGQHAASAAVFGFCLLPGTAQALGLGPLKIDSHLGSPLRASAPIRVDAGDTLEGLEAAVASPEDYEMVGKDRPPMVDGLQVRLLGEDPPRLRLTSTAPLQDPLFEVMVRVGDGSNQVYKVYTVALDPPRAAPPRAESAQGSGSGTKEGSSRETPSPGQTAKDSAAAAEGAAPPSGQEAGPAVERPRVRVTEGWAKRDRYGPVRPGDSLSTIAKRIRRDPSVPVASAVVALWRSNPEAFIDRNMNLLREGAVLEIPPESRVRGISPDEALEVIREQRRKWAQRDQPGAETRPGHERYKVKVSLKEPGRESAGNQTGAGELSGGSPAASVGGAAPSGGDKAAEGAESPDQHSEGGEGEPAAPKGESAKPAPAKAAKAESGQSAGSGADAGLLARRAAQVGLLRQVFEDQPGNGGVSRKLAKRVSSLSQRVEKQQGLIRKQSTVLKRLAQRAAGSWHGSNSYVLWSLAGINLLLLLAVVALWSRLRRIPAPPAERSRGGGAGPEEPPEAPEADPLTVANAQAAAGEFKQARSTLWEALALQPRDWAIYGRLLDLYEQEGDGEQFEEVSRRLFDQLGSERPEWQEEIRARGRRLKPESGLFTAPGGEDPPAPREAAGGIPEAGPEPEPPSEDPGLGLDAGEGRSPGPAPGQSPASGEGPLPGDSPEPEGTAPAETPQPEELELDFDLGLGDEARETGEETPGAGEGPAAGPLAESDLVFPGESPEGAGLPPESDRDRSGGAEDELELPGLGEDEGFAERIGPEGSDPGAGDELELGSGELTLELADSEEESPEAPGAGGEGAGTEAGGAPSEESGEAAAEEDLSLELDSWELETAEEQWGTEGDWTELASGGESGSEGAPSGQEGQGEDEFEIKLDLARAWIDMGDPESAKGLLQEVEARGGARQRERAQEILASLS